MDNLTFYSDILQLEGLKVSPQYSSSAFVFLLLIYIFITVSNMSLMGLIALERSLHEPMYLLFCNMSVNDVFGATAIVPRLLSDIFTPVSERYIWYVDCVVQAFAAHFHAGTSHTALMIMAFDRYVAICNPLQYATIMSSRMVMKLSVGAWVTAFLFVAVLMGLAIRLSRCRRAIINPFCDNASVFKLSCENILLNHVYGLASAALILGCSFCSISLTYLRIAAVCLSSKSKALNSRALQTCATHLAVYLVMLVSSFTPMIFHRSPEWADSGKVASVLFFAVPPVLNPIIYGFNCKELRVKIIHIFHKNKVKSDLNEQTLQK